MSIFVDIPHGNGLSRRLMISIGVGFFAIGLIFVFFLSRYSSNQKINIETSDKDFLSDVSNEEMIDQVNSKKIIPVVDSENTTINLPKLPELPQKIQNEPMNVLQPVINQPQENVAEQTLKEAHRSAISVFTAASNHPAETTEHNSESPQSSQNLMPADKDEYVAQNNQAQKKAFLQTQNKTYLKTLENFENSHSPFEIKAGSLIPAILQTGINSDLPGQITAKISRNVFDTVTGNFNLIPQGTTLIGVYDSHVSYGQSRVLIAWQRLIFPNGSSFDLDGQPGADLIGQAGLHDQVDNHYVRIFGSSLMFSVFGALGQLSQPQQTNNAAPSISQIIYGAIGQQMSQTAVQLVTKNMNIQPTISIRPGTEFNVLLTRDMVLPNEYKS